MANNNDIEKRLWDAADQLKDIGKAVNAAMKAIEEYNEELKGILVPPKELSIKLENTVTQSIIRV